MLEQRTIPAICPHCGETFLRYRLNRPRFCSAECGFASRWGTRAERFWSKVDRSNPDGCWPWLGGCFVKDGWRYGAFWDGINNRLAHQVAWEIANDEPFPDGMQGNHTCDVSLCCRPDHVYPGTQADNMRDMANRGRSLKGDRHPLRLHPEYAAWGHRNGAYTHPERMPRGENHWRHRSNHPVVDAKIDGNGNVSP